ncbi:hypothetical protein [Methanococcoides sp. NM1]|nr:hypothetical protein [Methanococcoides sp. NM1]
MKSKIIYGPVLSRRLGRSLGIDAKDLAVIIEELLREKILWR